MDGPDRTTCANTLLILRSNFIWGLRTLHGCRGEWATQRYVGDPVYLWDFADQAVVVVIQCGYPVSLI